MTASSIGARRVQRRRDKLRASGLRPVRIRVPDTRAAGFVQECERQARLIRAADEQATTDHDARFAVTDVARWTA